MRFRVTSQYGKGPEDVAAQFKNQTDAELFCSNKVAQDASMRTNVIYRLYDSFDLVKEYDANAVQSESSSAASGGDQGAKQASAFKPTPLNTKPTPPGLPKDWWSDEDDEKK